MPPAAGPARAAPLRAWPAGEPQDGRLQGIARTVYECLADNAPLAELGNTIGASTRTFSRLFHDEFGMTSCEWRSQLRPRPPRRRPRRHPDRLGLRLGYPRHLHHSLPSVIGATPGEERRARPRAGAGALQIPRNRFSARRDAGNRWPASNSSAEISRVIAASSCAAASASSQPMASMSATLAAARRSRRASIES
jgi:AraC-like DNA-binding protein